MAPREASLSDARSRRYRVNLRVHHVYRRYTSRRLAPAAMCAKIDAEATAESMDLRARGVHFASDRVDVAPVELEQASKALSHSLAEVASTRGRARSSCCRGVHSHR